MTHPLHNSPREPSGSTFTKAAQQRSHSMTLRGFGAMRKREASWSASAVAPLFETTGSRDIQQRIGIRGQKSADAL
jgi:hypothetical protein